MKTSQSAFGTSGDHGITDSSQSEARRHCRAISAKAGSKAWGQARFAIGRGTDESLHVRLERVRLQVGNAQVPLRGTQI
jgi:hypothetical protein